MKEQRLLREFKLFEGFDIKKSTSSDGILRMSGILQSADKVNANNRIYPKPILVREDTKYQPLIKDRRSLGCLDHPDNAIVELKNVSHLITKTWWNVNDLLGELEILDTPMGEIAAKLVNRNIKLGVSSRGLGSTEPNNSGCDVVCEDFQLVAVDLVSSPSTQAAFLHLKEHAEFKQMFETNKWVSLDDLLNQILQLG